MPNAHEFSESVAKVTNAEQSMASNNFMKEVQTYQEQKLPKNLKGEAETLTGDEAVKKFFNGKEVNKILNDFVINHDPQQCFEPKGPKNLKEEGRIDTSDKKFLRY